MCLVKCDVPVSLLTMFNFDFVLLSDSAVSLL
jgi:hypothetical protein